MDCPVKSDFSVIVDGKKESPDIIQMGSKTWAELFLLHDAPAQLIQSKTEILKGGMISKCIIEE